MRRYIFTDWERRLLEEWLNNGAENQSTRDLLSKIRQGWPILAIDRNGTAE